MIDPVPPDIVAQSRLLVETERWRIAVPLTFRAMAWWGAFTDWCVAEDDGAFGVYDRQGPLLVFRERASGRGWLLHPATGEFRNDANRRAGWRGFLMRHPDAAGAVLAALDGLPRPDAVTASGVEREAVVWVDVTSPDGFALRREPDAGCVRTRMVLKADGNVIASSYVGNARYGTFAVGMDATAVQDSVHQGEVAMCNAFQFDDDRWLSTGDTVARAKLIAAALNFVGADWQPRFDDDC